MNNIISDMKSYIKYITGALVALMTLGLVSCDYIHEDLQPCDHYLHFTYTHNMKFADAFQHELFANRQQRQLSFSFSMQMESFCLRNPSLLKHCKRIAFV